MKIQELRIGNWFIGYNGKPFQWSLGHFGLLTLKKNRLEIDDIIKSPIPLTEEILLKCGFDFSENAYFSPIFNLVSRLRIVGHDGDFRLLLNTKMAIKVEYLHQLQNLFFDLTGEELEVKL